MLLLYELRAGVFDVCGMFMHASVDGYSAYFGLFLGGSSQLCTCAVLGMNQNKCSFGVVIYSGVGGCWKGWLQASATLHALFCRRQCLA